MGASQFAVVRDVSTIQSLSWLIEGLPGPIKVWPSLGPRFSPCFSFLCTRLNISYLNLVPASLRSGGTKHYLLSCLSMEQLMFMGCWAVQSSLGIYVQEAMAFLVQANIDAATWAQLQHISANTR
eukprot:4863344-Karenia_brevis.AAC.1